jgi:hypothetical protein
MTPNEPDYTTLPLADLLDVERHIDREQVPERWATLQAALAERRAGTAHTERSDAAQGPMGPLAFMALHMIVTPVLFVLMLVVPESKGEAAAGRDLSLFLVVPAAFFISAGSILLHPLYLRARRRGRFLLISLVIAPIASVAALVLGSSALFSLLTTR